MAEPGGGARASTMDDEQSLHASPPLSSSLSVPPSTSAAHAEGDEDTCTAATACAGGNTDVSMKHIVMRPIGVVRSPFKQKFGIPRQPGLAPSAVSTIELLPPYNTADSVRGLGEWSHVWVEFVFHKTASSDVQTDGDINGGDHADHPQSAATGASSSNPPHVTPPSAPSSSSPSVSSALTASRPRPLVRPPRLGGSTRVGVFSSRATYRPNPIGLSACKLLGVDVGKGGRVAVRLEGADLLDGTPVLDIKPYLPYADCIPAATGSYAPTPPTAVPVNFAPAAEAQLDALVALQPGSPRRRCVIRLLLDTACMCSHHAQRCAVIFLEPPPHLLCIQNTHTLNLAPLVTAHVCSRPP
jgi:tRNA-Thr(GGU) m(6)t(6)A37 methyltransferase TsaA